MCYSCPTDRTCLIYVLFLFYGNYLYAMGIICVLLKLLALYGFYFCSIKITSMILEEHNFVG